MKIFKRNILIFLTFCAAFLACVDPYSIDISSSKGYIIIDGVLTDLNEPQFLTIFRTSENAQFKSSEFTSIILAQKKEALPVTDANAKIIVDGKQSINLQETLPGYYYLPDNFKAKVGSTYQLWFQTINGKTYESPLETMLPVSAIGSVREEFNKTGVKKYPTSDERISTNDFYVDFQDNPNEKNFYRWRWTQWETQKYCETCSQGRYFLYEDENGENGTCYRDLTLNYNNIFDYTCGTSCWDIFYSSDINIFSDVFTDGQLQKNKLVAQIPLYQSNQCLVSIQQMSLSPNAFRYFKLIQDQSVNTGTLADTPPAPIKSNVYNKDDAGELVLGYFSVSAVSEQKYMLTRKNATGTGLNALFFAKNNRLPQPEESSVERLDIPLAICKKSLSRTPIKPAGWQIQ